MRAGPSLFACVSPIYTQAASAKSGKHAQRPARRKRGGGFA